MFVLSGCFKIHDTFMLKQVIVCIYKQKAGKLSSISYLFPIVQVLLNVSNKLYLFILFLTPPRILTF